MRATYRSGGFSLTGLWLLAGLLVLVPLAATAQDSTWTGSTGAWNTSGNWTPFAPIAGALINNGGTATVGAGENSGTGQVWLGSTGTGSLLVNGGLYHSILTYMGDQAGSVGTLTLTSGTVTLSPSASFGGLVVGNSGTGTMLISGPNASVLTYSVVIGNSAGGYGTTTITSGTMFSTMLGIGGQGTGNLLINGGSVLSGTSFFGFGSNTGNGTATVTGGLWQSYVTTVGISGTGRLQIDGGEVYSPTLNIASGTSVGTVALNGGVLRTNQVVKGTGTALFQFAGGTLAASADSSDFLSGFSSAQISTSGTAAFDTAGFAITSTVGLAGTAVLHKLGAGTLSLTGSNSYTGGTIVRSGTLAVNGGAINHAARSVIVGNISGDVASISLNGGRISGLNTFLGNAAGSTGKATVTSGTWTTANIFYVGTAGSGELLINGGLVSDSVGFIAFNPGMLGTARITSGTWSHSNYLAVGDQGEGRLVIDGGLVSNSNGYVGLGAGGSGTATVNGGTWATTNILTVGGQGQGTLTIVGGIVSSGTVLLAETAGSQGTLNLGAGGTMGTLQTAVVTGGTGSAKVNFNHTGAVSFGAKLEGSLAVAKLGSGTLTLTGSSTYTGGTDVQAGTLILTDIGATQSVLGSGTVRIGAGATLSGVGTILGDTTLEGTLAPGNSPGEMHFASSLFMGSTADVQMELASLSSFDHIAVDGVLAYNGTLSITLLGGYLPEVGDTFDLFDAGAVASGSDFTAIAFSDPDYQGTFNTSTGVLTITAVPEPTAAALLAGGLVAMLVRRRRE